MFLAFRLVDIIQVPFGYLMSALYQLTANYGWTLILFALVVKIILFPATAKGKKSSMKMSRLSPQIQALQKKYENDQQKQSEAVRQLYKEEGVSMGGGCLWSLVPLLILRPLYAVVRQPITYMLHETSEVAAQIVAIINENAPGLFSGNNFYEQMAAAPVLPDFAAQLKEAIPSISEKTLEGVNFDFFDIDLAAIPQFNVFKWEKWDWAHIGAFLIPILSAGSQVVSMLISQKMNNSLVTDEKGLEDKETAKKSQANQTSKTMMYTMPLMSLWIGFTLPCALSLYWLAQGIVSTLGDVYLTNKYRKIYDAEDAERLAKLMEEELAAQERERIRAERRAANPDGQTQNTSKKKLQKQQQAEADAAKAAAAKEYAMKKGTYAEEETEEKNTALSGIPERPYCKGRAYDPDRYKTTEE